MSSSSPTFTSYSHSRLAEIAARVAEQFSSDEFYDEFYLEREGYSEFVERETGNRDEDEEEEEESEEFEFAFTKRGSEVPSPVSADEIFCNGQIRPSYPIFNTDLFLERNKFEHENERENGVVSNWDCERCSTVRLPLRKLFVEERETTMTMAPGTWSSSSSEAADELEGVPDETYCVWRPDEETAAVEKRDMGKKSNSAGSNFKRWKFKDLLHRSLSEGGKNRFVFSSRSSNGRRRENEENDKSPVAAGKLKSAAQDRTDKRRSYFPHRKDLIGLFASVNGLSKNLHPF